MKKGLIIGAIIVMIGIIAMTIAVIVGGKEVYNVAPVGDRQEYTFTDDYKEIHFNTHNRGVNVKLSPDNDIHLVAYENEDRYYKFTEDENLTIEYVEHLGFFNNNIISLMEMSEKPIELYIPNNLEQKLFIDAENGVVQVSNVELNSIDLDNQNAIVVLDNVTTLNDIAIDNSNALIDINGVKSRDFNLTNENGVISIDTLDGDNVKIKNQNSMVSVNNVYSNNNVEISNQNAFIDFNNIEFEKELNINSSNSGVSGTLPNVQNDYTFDLSTQNGKVELNGAMVNGVTGNGSKLVKVRCENANINISTK